MCVCNTVGSRAAWILVFVLMMFVATTGWRTDEQTLAGIAVALSEWRIREWRLRLGYPAGQTET